MNAVESSCRPHCTSGRRNLRFYYNHYTEKYQISVTDENYKRTKCYKIKSKNKTTYKIKGLKRHKKYYISLQTYKKVKPSKKYKGVNLWKKMESYGVHKTVKTK